MPTPDEYRDNVGHEPPVDDTDNAWMWEYTGSRAEREGLLERMSDDEFPPAVDPHPDQMTLG